MFTLQANISKNVPIIDLYDTKSQQSLVKGWEKIMKITSAPNANHYSHFSVWIYA